MEMVMEELFSSSSDDDSDLELIDHINDFININEGRCYCNLCKPRVPRINNFIAEVVDILNDGQFQEHFRLSRPTFEYLLYLIRPDLDNIEGGRLRIAAEKQLYIALWFLGTPDTYRSVTTKFGVSPATAWWAVRRVVMALCKLRSYFIKWPTPQECHDTSRRIETATLFPGVIGAVDGTHVRILAPKSTPEAYINRKGYHSLQLKVVCNDRLEFLHCYGGLSGSVHDALVFKYSGLQQRCLEEFFPNDCHLLGDSAYAIQRQVMVPFRDNGHLTVEPTYFNKRLSSCCMMVERSIGLLKGRWRLLLDKVPMRRTDLIPSYIMACCVLHNVCLKCEDTFEFPIDVPDVYELAEPLEAPNENKVAGNLKRIALCERLNHV